MERVIFNSSAMTVIPKQRVMGKARRCEGEPDARKRAERHLAGALLHSVEGENPLILR
jgi:hypothetical protein